ESTMQSFEDIDDQELERVAGGHPCTPMEWVVVSYACANSALRSARPASNRARSPGSWSRAVFVGRWGKGSLSAAGTVKCWGLNGAGELGVGDARDRGIVPGDMGDALPALAFGKVDSIAKIGAGDVHACALSAAGDVFCWGKGGSGQLGTEASADV